MVSANHTCKIGGMAKVFTLVQGRNSNSLFFNETLFIEFNIVSLSAMDFRTHFPILLQHITILELQNYGTIPSHWLTYILASFVHDYGIQPHARMFASLQKRCMLILSSFCTFSDFGMARDVYETDYYRKGGKGMKIVPSKKL